MTATATYRKTKTGEWVAYGTTATVHAGPVQVAKRDGTVKTETVSRLGRPFTVGGEQMVYGYLQAGKSAPVGTRRDRYAACEDCEWVEDAGDMNGCRRHRGNPYC